MMKLKNNDQSFKVRKVNEMDVHFGCSLIFYAKSWHKKDIGYILDSLISRFINDPNKFWINSDIATYHGF